MIYRVRVTGSLATTYFVAGKEINKTKVLQGIPEGCRLFHVYPSEHGDWILLFEGKPDDGTPDVEGKIRDAILIYQEYETELDRVKEVLAWAIENAPGCAADFYYYRGTLIDKAKEKK